jgi:predicted amino acid-binding ACT domain protein
MLRRSRYSSENKKEIQNHKKTIFYNYITMFMFVSRSNFGD